MATFLTSVLNSEPIFFVSSYDPAIDWVKTQAAGMTRADYINNPFEQVHKLHKKDGEEFIRIELNPPRQVDTLVALSLAGVSYDENGALSFAGSDDMAPGLRASLGSSLAHPKLALLCVADVYNLDDWPSPCRKPYLGSTHILTDEAQALLPDVLLEEIGLVINRLDSLGNGSGSESDVSPSGDISSDGTNTQTLADSAEETTDERFDDSGVVIGARSQADPDEMTA
jgi:hypothetical protein